MTRRFTRPRHCRRGMFLADTLLSLAAAAVLLVTLAAATGGHARAARALADRRAAARDAEAALLALAAPHGGAPHGDRPPLPPTVTLTRLDAPAPSPRLAWVEAAATVNAHTARVTGLVPADAARAAEARHAK